MRNIVVLRDQLYAITDGTHNEGAQLVSITFDKASSKMFTLSQDGTLLCFSDIDDDIEPVFKAHAYIGASDVDVDADHGWFEVTYIAGTGCIVMISHSGVIASLEQEIECTDNTVHNTTHSMDYPLVAEQIGCIEGGIAAAAWSPDQSCLVIVTNNNTLLCMSSTWDVLLETPVPERLTSGPTASISWRGDGEGFALTTVDKEDGVCRMRHYNKQLEVVATGRNVADGAASVMRGIGNVVAFASNGSYIAVCQQQRGAGNSATVNSSTSTAASTTAVVGAKTQPKLQVALIERNGLRHGDFDLHLPPVPAGWDRWEECSLHWDLPTTLLAVGLRAVRDANSDASTTQSGCPGMVQLYYRGNYHWYLKQQWAGQDLRFLGFDEELVNRFYLSQSLGTENGSSGANVWRVVDFAWDVASTSTADSTVAVVDGQKLLLTPLGINNIPPPMCKHSVSLTAAPAVTETSTNSTLPGIIYPGASLNCVRNVSFWQPYYSPSFGDIAPAKSNIAWGCASLGDNNTSLAIAFGDSVGNVLSQHQIGVQALCCSNAALHDLFATTAFRALAAAQQDGVVRLALLGSHVVPLTVPTTSGPCEAAPCDEVSTECLLVLELAYDHQLNTFSALPMRCEVVPLPGGCATRVVTVPHQPSVFAVGIIRSSVAHNGSEFEIYKVHLGDGLEQAEEELVASLPEQCTHIAFIAATAAIAAPAVDSESIVAGVVERASTVIALSLRNRLYCGESLLASGASSFVYNESFEILMYGTLGTRPHLHFCSLSRLLALDPMQHSEDQESAECAEPRPVERGAKLVISAAGSSRVVLQLPRGNLETIEPRPLILLRAQHLLHDNQLLECLVLLRKQRVDLNYVVDYSPRIFLDNVSHFVSTMLRTNHDLISLLVTALEPVDVTVHKYPLFASAPEFMQEREVADFGGDNKVNRVCAAVRNVLLPILYAARSAAKVDDVHSSKVLQPILCTFARQRPPQLVEALDLIRFCCTTGGIITAVAEDTVAGTPPSATISGGTTNLSSPMAQVSIKYLAFLAEGTQLFDAALGICDFETTRAVARQCQMDPKVYLPVVESFETLGRGFESASPQVAIMHFKVNQHLKRFLKAVEWAVALLESAHNAHSATEESVEANLVASITTVIQELKVIIKAEELYRFTLPKLAALELKLRLDSVTFLSATSSAHGSNAYDVVICNLVSDLRLQWGQICASKMEYAEALASILATQPMHALEAVEVAKQSGNWQLALSIAGRYQHEERYNGVTEIKPVYIAQQIVSEFRENLEQGGTCDNLTSGVEGGADGSVSVEGDKVLEAARLCVDYCSDHEGAIAILTTAQRWLPALQLALRYSRKDLLFEIAGAARMAAEELIAELPRRAGKMRALVQELSELWVNPAERLKNVASTDVTLMDELNGVDAANQRQNDDTMSEYSAVTQQSTFSRTSTRSGSSQYSTMSGSSVVSVLSNLSAASHQSALDRDNKSASAFSIAGLEHSLLSRGTVTAKSEQAEGSGGAGKVGKRSKKQYRRDQTERRQKRIERSKAKGASKDVWGLRREGAACEELLVYARRLTQLSQSIRELCEALQLISEPGDLALCMALQSACDTYMRFVQQNPPSVGPNYPREWLAKRLLTSVQHYQDPAAYAAAAAALPHNQAQQEISGGSVAGAGMFTAGGFGAAQAQGASVTTWWDIAAAGLRGWYATTKLTFSTGATGSTSC